MPRILIKETDQTSAGTPSSYENYSVLLIGFSKYDAKTRENMLADNASKLDLIKPDENDIYEFTTKGSFADTIGLVGPKIEDNIFHYGNQMAYELLGLGYTVIYKPITKTDLLENITKDIFWSIFKDKASYDFRFITHGLVTASKMYTGYYEDMDRLPILEQDNAALENISKEADIKYPAAEDGTRDENTTLLWQNFKEDAYKKLIADLEEDSPKFTYFDSEQEKWIRYEGFGDIVETDEGNITGIARVGAYNGVANELATVTARLESDSEDKITPFMFNEVNGQIANLAKYIKGDEDKEPIPGRGDCVALIELDESAYNGSLKPEVAMIAEINRISQVNADNGKYCAMTAPSVVYNMADNEDFNNNKKFPGAFHYLACFKQSLGLGFAEWYAAAGYTRGVSSYVIDHTTAKLGEIAINALEPRNMATADAPKFACNVIANFRGSYYLWGNRTAHPLGSKDGGNDLVASHFLNIRQLCTTIKKQLYVACRRFTFDPNSDTLWVNFCAAIRPTLEAMKADQGVRDYKIVKEFTDKKATLKAKIRIIPIEAVEDFDLEVSLEDSFGETTAVVNE